MICGIEKSPVAVAPLKWKLASPLLVMVTSPWPVVPPFTLPKSSGFGVRLITGAIA